MKSWLLVLVFIGFAVAQQSQQSQPDQCGFRGNIHDCHCAARTATLQAKIVEFCNSKNQKDKDIAACVKYEMRHPNEIYGDGVGFHCRVAERVTKWDEGLSDSLEGDQVKSQMGEFCKRACKPHRCSCSEESCDYH